MNGKYKFGQRVLVHQSGGLDLSDTPKYGFRGIKTIAHDCSNPEQHWESRIIGWDDFHNCPMIATRVGNPCHAEWPYTEDCLTPIEGSDWVDTSSYKVGDALKFRWDCHHNLHYPDGTILDAKIEAAHIKPGDWYVSFPVPGNGVHDGWRFRIVVNEKDFLGGSKEVSHTQTNAWDQLLSNEL